MATDDTARAPAGEEQAQREIAHEQAYVDVVYGRLEQSAVAARALAAEGYARGHLGHEGGLVERDAMVFQAAKRIAALDAAHDGLVFGRLDNAVGDPRYIGRIGVRDSEREILLIDWRAPAAAVFYQATAQDPAGVVRRRVLRCSGAVVVGVEDDLLDAGRAPDDMVVVGEGALLASLSRARDSTMHSVVATIQKEQDAAIRAPSRGATTIGGGPGTGKTVVALHRAAYLLYTDRRRFESGGVLVVGPSGVFMGYIERVLPSLGETSVTLRSLGEVVDGLKSHRHDVPAVAAAKGSSRMVRVLGRAVEAAQPGEPTEFRYFYKDDVLRLSSDDLHRLRRQLLGSGQKRNRAYNKVRGVLLDTLWSQVKGDRALENEKEGFVDTIESEDSFDAFVESWWPPLEAVEVWETLRDRERLTRYGRDVLTADEIDAMVRAWERHPDPSVEDVPLVDELRYLLGETRSSEDEDDTFEVKQLMSFERQERDDRDERERLKATGSIEDDGFAHVLVDEAQDLSPMQWRMLGRRGRYSSWTIVGDAAQSSWPHPEEAARARREALAELTEHAFRLSTNYRNSAEIYDLAADVARVGIDSPDLPEAVRRTGVDPEHRTVDTLALGDAAESALRDLAAAVEGTIAIVVPVGLREQVTGRLASLVAELDGRASVLDGLDTKGLEFDAVLVVEPDGIVQESPAGWRTLYVVLTRATQRLLTVGSTQHWLDRARPEDAR